MTDADKDNNIWRTIWQTSGSTLINVFESSHFLFFISKKLLRCSNHQGVIKCTEIGFVKLKEIEIEMEIGETCSFDEISCFSYRMS